MSIHLVGGGSGAGIESEVYGPFVDEVLARATDEESSAVIAVLTVREHADPAHAQSLAAALLTAAGGRAVQIASTVVAEGERMPQAALEGADGIVVGGGLTPAYLTAFAPLGTTIRDVVAAGMPYLGFSAGAMIAPDRALIGGWRIDGVEIGAEEASEDLDELTVDDGLGLIDVTIDVHAVQWGNLSRAISAVDAGVVGDVIAIDENTVLTVGNGPLRAGGAGTVWVVTKDERGVLVRSLR